jgi:hypothetical protein
LISSDHGEISLDSEVDGPQPIAANHAGHR